MQLIIKNGKVIATYEDYQQVANLYPNTECVLWDKPIQHPKIDLSDPFPDDPRSQKQKLDNYKDRRRVAYPSVEDQLDMIYHDKKDGTDTFVESIDDVKIKYPKPETI